MFFRAFTTQQFEIIKKHVVKWFSDRNIKYNVKMTVNIKPLPKARIYIHKEKPNEFTIKGHPNISTVVSDVFFNQPFNPAEKQKKYEKSHSAQHLAKWVGHEKVEDLKPALLEQEQVFFGENRPVYFGMTKDSIQKIVLLCQAYNFQAGDDATQDVMDELSRDEGGHHGSAENDGGAGVGDGRRGDQAGGGRAGGCA